MLQGPTPQFDVGSSTPDGAATGSKSRTGPQAPKPWHRRPIPPAALTAGVFIPICIGTFLLMQQWRAASTHAAGPPSGRLIIDSRPSGVEVTVDGRGRGPTPLTLSLEAGNHTMTLRHDSEERIVSVVLAAGTEIQHYFDFTLSHPPVPVHTAMSVTTDPPKAQVSVDGVPRGTSPVTIEDVTPGQHRVTATNGSGSAERTVTVEPGGALSVVFALPTASTPAVGWLKLSAPFEVDILEKNELLGTSAASKLMLASGRHEITLANRTLGYSENRRADVVAARTTTVQIEPPMALLSANAKPWADVTLDGKPIGQTPIANVEVPIGTHEAIFRHPEFGERRQTVVVTLHGPNRIGMDLTK
jgi:serine/threonine-protein kinase